MAMLTAEDAPAPLEAIQATKKEKSTAMMDINSSPGFAPLMKVGIEEADDITHEYAGDGHHHAG